MCGLNLTLNMSYQTVLLAIFGYLNVVNDSICREHVYEQYYKQTIIHQTNDHDKNKKYTNTVSKKPNVGYTLLSRLGFESHS